MPLDSAPCKNALCLNAYPKTNFVHTKGRVRLALSIKFVQLRAGLKRTEETTGEDYGYPEISNYYLLNNRIEF